MIRRAAAVAVALCLSPAWLSAQTITVFTVKAASADVHLSPSTGSPVIGRAPNQAVLEVTRELGSWVKVPWAGVPEGVGYVHVSMGSIGPGSSSELSRQTESASAQPASESRPAPQSVPIPAAIGAESPVARARLPAIQAVYVTPSTHRLGFGGRVGTPSNGFGASARAWSHKRLGIQLEMSRHVLDTTEKNAVRVSSIQFEPSLIYSLPDRVTDFVWVRPYLGSGVSLVHQTLGSVTPGVGSVSEGKRGLQVFGGSELTFAGVPQFALSVDLRYRWAQSSFAGADFGGPGAAVSGHWYVK